MPATDVRVTAELETLGSLKQSVDELDDLGYRHYLLIPLKALRKFDTRAEWLAKREDYSPDEDEELQMVRGALDFDVPVRRARPEDKYHDGGEMGDLEEELPPQLKDIVAEVDLEVEGLSEAKDSLEMDLTPEIGFIQGGVDFYPEHGLKFHVDTANDVFPLGYFPKSENDYGKPRRVLPVVDPGGRSNPQMEVLDEYLSSR